MCEMCNLMERYRDELGGTSAIHLDSAGEPALKFGFSYTARYKFLQNLDADLPCVMLSFTAAAWVLDQYGAVDQASRGLPEETVEELRKILTKLFGTIRMKVLETTDRLRITPTGTRWWIDIQFLLYREDLEKHPHTYEQFSMD